MVSDDSDDEPLAVVAANKKRNSPEEILGKLPKIPKKKKHDKLKKLVAVVNRRSYVPSPLKERPDDVWLYLKDFNPTGPYSCLLCSDWFINRSKIIAHYVLNHRKDFCGICRYFVPDRESWISHLEFHKPWQCSQCPEIFMSENDLRVHFSTEHNLVHCRLCYFRISDNDQYNCHLYEKHSVTNVSSKNTETLWELEFEGSPKFHCFLCSKPNNLSANFFNHYMSYHHMTLKCLSSLISGTDPPFTVEGANIRVQFLDQLKLQPRYGYLESEAKTPDGDRGSVHSDNSEHNVLLKALIPEVKQEVHSDTELQKMEIKPRRKHSYQSDDDNDETAIWNTYEGDTDFDVTSTELIIIQECYFDYINQTCNDLESNVVSVNSTINYDDANSDLLEDFQCPMCADKFHGVPDFTAHVNKMHGVRIPLPYSCRVCATNFESQNELATHAAEELKEFDDLWMCQFCEKEFDTREETRRHLSKHWSEIQMDNCFSPHLGFKCRYCPTLFWNEMDRELHQTNVHYDNKHKEDFYKCAPCDKLFCDKVLYTHHYFKNHYNLDDGNNQQFLLKCCICCVVLQSMDDIRNHFEVEHKEAKKIYCSVGNCSFKPLAQRKSFKIHLRTMHRPENTNPLNKPTCEICFREFGTMRAVHMHMTQIHAIGRFKCKLCKESLHTADERKLHYLLRHPGRHPFQCSLCDKSFPYKSSLYTHKLEHQTVPQSFTCTYCNKVFAKKDSFREHVQIHTGPRHSCSYCPMRFVQRSNMLRHERRHTGERPYSCSQCPSTFTDKGAANSHMRTHTKERSFRCGFCGRTFAQKSKLTYHTRKHTGENLEKCPVCAKLYTSAGSLREHMKSHDKNNQVPCPLCSKLYRDERYMVRHMRAVHSDSKGVTCPLCNKCVSSNVVLRQHILTHSKRKIYSCNICPRTFSVKRSTLKHVRRRHGISLTGDEINVDVYFNTLDVRDCNLGLDDEYINKLFGPRKEVVDITFGEFVKFPFPFDETSEKSDNNNASTSTSSRRSVSKRKGSRLRSVEDTDSDSDNGNSGPELEPTDFVSVKIEPMLEEDDGGMEDVD